MSGIAAASLAGRSGHPAVLPALPRAQAADSPAAINARQALAKAQGRVDADRAAHSPDCVAFDQKGVDAASAAVAQAEDAAWTRASIQPRPGDALSITA